MDAQQFPTSDAPTFKLAKVGKDRKRGGAAWFGGKRGAAAGIRVLGGGAGSGGAGAAIASGSLGAKFMMIMLVSSVSSFGFRQLSSALRGDVAVADSTAKKAFVPAPKVAQTYDDLSGVIKGENTIPNSPGFVSGTADGLTPAERAQKAADEAAARKAEEEAQKKADEEAAMQASIPAAQPDGAGLKGDKPTLKNFNKMDSRFGGSAGGSKLAGGAGLSGGVTRGFAMPSVGKAKNGSLSSFGGGAKTSVVKTAHASAPASRSRGFAKRQLVNANIHSNLATTVRGTHMAEEGYLAFNEGPAAGASTAGGGMTSGSNSQGAPSTFGPGNEGGPTGGSPCGASEHPGPGGGGCLPNDPPPPVTHNACRYQKQIDLANQLLIAIAVLSAIALGLQKLADAKIPYYSQIAAVAAWIVKYAVVALAAVVCALGVMIATMSGGDFLTGAVVGAVGGYIAYTILTRPEVTTDKDLVVKYAAGSMQAAALGMLTSSLTAGKSQAAANQ